MATVADVTDPLAKDDTSTHIDQVCCGRIVCGSQSHCDLVTFAGTPLAFLEAYLPA